MRTGMGLGASAPPVVGPNLYPVPLSAYGIGGNGASTWVFDFTINATTGANQLIWRVDNNTGANVYELMYLNTGNLAFRRLTANVIGSAVIFTPTFGVRYGFAAALAGDGTGRGKVHTQTAGTVTGGPLSGLLSGRWGATATGTLTANAAYKFNTILRGAVSDADLDALAARAAAW